MSDPAPLLDAAALAAAGREPVLPFRVACIGGELLVRRLLRVLPGRRVVGEAQHGGRTVLAKLFVGSRAERRWRQEADGLAALAGQGLPTPLLLLSERLSDGGYVLLTEFVAPSTTLSEDWRALPQPVPGDVSALAVLRPAFTLLGRMHARGLVQEDLHLGNFLRAGERVYVIDGDSVRALSSGKPLAPAAALRNLAILCAQLPAEWDAQAEALLATYLSENAGVQVARPELLREVARIRAARLADYLAKTTRDCTLFAVEQRFDRFTAVVRDETEVLAEVLARPDALLAAGQLLKKGNTCTVARVMVVERPLVIKRYNLKNLGHALGRLWRPSRAWHSWREAHRLDFLGIPTPRPLALIEERAGPLRRRAWLITDYCAGVDLSSRWHAAVVPPADEAAALLSVIAGMHRAQISHGDLKATNLIWHAGKVYVIDLDAMVQHRSATAYAKAWRRDRARLLRNWPSDSELVCWLDANLPPA